MVAPAAVASVMADATAEDAWEAKEESGFTGVAD
jgi:hypothetical protein